MPFTAHFFAYLQGLIVLLAGSWFHYQILSNFILYLISGFSMLILLRYVNVRNWVSVPVAVFIHEYVFYSILVYQSRIH